MVNLPIFKRLLTGYTMIEFSELSIEHYVIVALAFISLVLIFISFRQRRKIRIINQEWVADRINLEDASEKEKWFRLITQNIPKAFWIFDADRTWYVSPVFTKITGIEEKDIRHPVKMLDYMEEGFREQCEKKMQLFLQGQTSRIQTTCKLVLKPETWFQFEYYSLPGHSGDGQFVAMVEEITSQHENIRELETDRNRLGLVLQYSDLSLFDWDLSNDKIHLSGNLFSEAMANANDGQINAGEWKSRIHPEDLETDELLMQHCREGKTPFYQNELRFNTNLNEYKWLLIRGEVSERDAQNNPLRMAGIALDIHRRKNMEIQLRNNQILLRDVLSSSDEGIYVLDKNFRVLFWNPQMEKISGKKREEVIDSNDIFTHFPHLIKNGIIRVIKETIEGNISDGHVVPFRLEEPDREGYTFEKYLPLKNSLGQIIGVIGFVKDMTDELDRETELTKTRERHELTLQAIKDGIWDWDLENEQIVMSDQWFALLGYKPGELTSSLDTFRSLLDPIEAAQILIQYREAFEQNQPIAMEYRMRHRDGHWLWIESRGGCVQKDKDGKPLRALGTHSNITERQLTEQKVREAMEKAEESDRLKSSFLANMSHELRTPLNAIVGFSELLTTEDLFPEEKETYIVQIKQNSESLIQLISDIIDLAKIESNRLEIHQANVSITRLITEVYENTKLNHSKEKLKYIGLETDIPDDLKSASIFTDPIRFRQILQNLTNNALKFTEEGQITIGVEQKAKNQLSFFVKDTGIGISKEDQNKIFNRFEQVESGLNRRYGGTGLGLNITQNLVRLLGGKIWVESEVGKGSTFWFTHHFE